MTRILVFGAGGRAGRAIVREARARKHPVTAAVRDRATYADLSTAGVDLVEADANDVEHVAAATPGHDVAVNATRPSWNNPTDHFIRMNNTLLHGLVGSDVRRLVLIGGAGTLETDDGVQFVDTPEFPDSGKPRGLAQRDALHALETERVEIDWVYLAPPPRFLPDGERTGDFRVVTSRRLADVTGTEISYADFAVGLVDEIETPRHSRERITITSGPVP